MSAGRKRIVMVGSVAGLVVTLVAACAPLFPAGSTLTVTSANGAILIQWPEAVESDAGQTVASYRVDIDGVEVARVPATVRSCQLNKVGTGTHTVSVTAYDSVGDWSGSATVEGSRVSARVTGPTADPTGTTPGCRGYGMTDWTTSVAKWRAALATLPVTGATANPSTCTVGTTTQAYRTAALAKMNAYRALVGVPNLTEDASYTASAQKGAALMAANGQLSHTPPVTWRCYTADGADAAINSNLAAGQVTNPANATYDALKAYMRDGTDAPHRRWLLCPGTTKIGFGAAFTQASTYYNQWDATRVLPNNGFAAGAARDGVVAWPHPGVVPVDLAAAANMLSLFSVQVPSTHSVANAAVTVTSSNGDTIAVTGLQRTDPWCSPAVTWTPGRAPTAGETWTVRITGLRDASGASYSTIWTTTYRTT